MLGKKLTIACYLMAALLVIGSLVKFVVITPELGKINFRPSDIYEKDLEKVYDLLSRNEFVQAKKTLSKVLPLDPINQELNKLTKQVDFELSQEVILKKAELAFSDKRYEISRRLLSDILPNSETYKKSKTLEIKLLKQERIKLRWEEAEARKNGDYMSAFDLLCKYLELSPEDTIANQRFIRISKLLRERGKNKKCKIFSSSKIPKELMAIVESRFDQLLRDPVIRFLNGDVERSLKMLNKIPNTKLSKSGQEELRNQLTDDIGRFKRYFSDIQFSKNKNITVEILANYKKCLVLLKELFGSAYEKSYWSISIKKDLSNHFYEQGVVHFSRKRFFEAKKSWDRGLDIYDDNLALRAGLAKITKIAEKMYFDAGSRGVPSENIKRLLPDDHDLLKIEN